MWWVFSRECAPQRRDDEGSLCSVIPLVLINNDDDDNNNNMDVSNAALVYKLEGANPAWENEYAFYVVIALLNSKTNCSL